MQTRHLAALSWLGVFVSIQDAFGNPLAGPRFAVVADANRHGDGPNLTPAADGGPIECLGVSPGTPRGHRRRFGRLHGNGLGRNRRPGGWRFPLIPDDPHASTVFHAFFQPQHGQVPFRCFHKIAC